ncbi:MAG: hypothetical protein COV74_02000 [Candidatus Omnitrophica bacterium CG11_big_fil_rev_8_21_14_0_20_45_26]|uniref:Toluene tolerance protein n=1 Tax=Candidatus Abzuiibacterium crystallinum TaxID=1974748 RepID=A0A2H0LRY4_9BACT|nr:MAG: hypothetical protein COV74_02000 [Candidatus Omnitrophica bacterium CG11_big_fil_rev_8_21_14_0_20_45_26]PIW65339.1 MAG: hypothetical protein COW12_02405 [Candidatus Omnitrophica bacterium CG12_big_fil_rev_8_21_14_0_65_45_16]
MIFKYIVSSFLRLLGIGVFCVSMLFAPAAIISAEVDSPKAVVETFLETLRAMEFPVSNSARHAQLVKKANAFLDLDAMGQKALRDHWEQASVEDRRDFLALLWQQIENRAYRKSHDFLGNLKVTYPESHEDSTGFVIKTVVRQEEKVLDAEVIYHLRQKEEGWKIDDVILDDVSLIEDLKYQFDKIIRDSSFSGLLKRMQERLDTAEKENQGGDL